MDKGLDAIFQSEAQRINKVSEVFGTDWDVELTPTTWGIFTSGHPQPRSGVFTWFGNDPPNTYGRYRQELMDFLMFYLPHFEPNPLKTDANIDSSKVNQDIFTKYAEQLNSLILQFSDSTAGFNQELLMAGRLEQEAMIEFINYSGIFNQRTLQWFGTMGQLLQDYAGSPEWYSKGFENRARLDFATVYELDLSSKSYIDIPSHLSNEFYKYIGAYTWPESPPLK